MSAPAPAYLSLRPYVAPAYNAVEEVLLSVGFRQSTTHPEHWRRIHPDTLAMSEAIVGTDEVALVLTSGAVVRMPPQIAIDVLVWGDL